MSEIISRLPEQDRAFSTQHGQIDIAAESIFNSAERFHSGRMAGTLVGDSMLREPQTEVTAATRSLATAKPDLAHEFSSRALLPRFIAQIELFHPRMKGLAKTLVGESASDPQTEVFLPNSP